jgi:hypothetical protein
VNPAALPVNTFFPFREVCGDYFAVLHQPEGWWTIKFAKIEQDGGVPTLAGEAAFAVACHPVASFNPQFCRDVAAPFGFNTISNAEDGEVLGRDPAEALRMGYQAEPLAQRRQRVKPLAGSVQPRRFYPLPDLNCYVLLTRDPLAVYLAPMTDAGGLVVRPDCSVPVQRVTEFTPPFAKAVNALFGTEFMAHG